MYMYLDCVEHFLYVISIFVQGFPRGGEEGDGLGALLHQSHARGCSEASPLKEIKDVAKEEWSKSVIIILRDPRIHLK